MPEVSVVIPVYNAETYLRECIDSVLAQTFTDFEIILIDDGSTDNSYGIVQQYEIEHPSKIRAFHQGNMGVALTRNRGIDLSLGRFIMFIDNDDYIDSNYLMKYYNKILESDVEYVIGSHIQVEADGRQRVRQLDDSSWSVYKFLTPWARMYSVDFLKKHDIQFLDTKMGEEIYCSIMAAVYAQKVAVITYAGYFWRVNQQSVSHTLQKGFQKNACPLKMLEALRAKIIIPEIETEKYDQYEYFNFKYCVWYLFDSGRHVGIQAMKSEYLKMFAFLHCAFPDWKVNRLLRISRPVGERIAVRVLVFFMMNLHKVGLDKIIYYLYAI